MTETRWVSLWAFTISSGTLQALTLLYNMSTLTLIIAYSHEKSNSLFLVERVAELRYCNVRDLTFLERSSF